MRTIRFADGTTAFEEWYLPMHSMAMDKAIRDRFAHAVHRYLLHGRVDVHIGNDWLREILRKAQQISVDTEWAKMESALLPSEKREIRIRALCEMAAEEKNTTIEAIIDFEIWETKQRLMAGEI